METTPKGFRLRGYSDNYDLDNIENYNTQKADELIRNIESKMMEGTQTPSEGDNQLANRNFVNSSISHMAAHFRGNWNTWNNVPTNYQDYPEDTEHNKKPSPNDYMVVADMTGYSNPDDPTRVYEGTWRFSYTGDWDDPISGGTRGRTGWKPIYQVNEKPLTQAQLDALNSGINATKVGLYDEHVIGNTIYYYSGKIYDQERDEWVYPTSPLLVNNIKCYKATETTVIELHEADGYFILGEGSIFYIPSNSVTENTINNLIADDFLEECDFDDVDCFICKYDSGTINFKSQFQKTNTSRNNPHHVTKEQVGLGNVDNTSDLNKPISNDQQAEFNKKINIDQGMENYGKILGIGEDGLTIPIDPPQGGATPEQLATKLDKTKDIRKIEVVNEMPEVKDLYTLYLVVEDEEEWPGLKLTSAQNNSSIGYYITGTIDKDIYISSDGKTWSPWDGTSILLNNGEYRYIWNKNNTLSKNENNCLTFNLSGAIQASGNIMSMIDFNDLTPYCFVYLFGACTSLLTAPIELPATKLANHCYTKMFAGCSSLVTAPNLPATTLAEGCYYGMFRNCSSLVNAPELPATELANFCYNNMFENCSSLVNAPDLPATGNISEKYAFVYLEMFKSCTSLTNIKLYYTGNFIEGIFIGWMTGVNTSGIIYYNGSDTTRGANAIPQNWSVQTFTP